MNPREAQLAGQKKAMSSNMNKTFELDRKRSKLAADLRKLGGKNLNPLDSKKATQLQAQITKIDNQLERLKGQRKSAGYNKGGYAKCGASNPPSKKR